MIPVRGLVNEGVKRFLRFQARDARPVRGRRTDQGGGAARDRAFLGRRAAPRGDRRRRRDRLGHGRPVGRHGDGRAADGGDHRRAGRAGRRRAGRAATGPARPAMATPRRLLARLRETMAHGTAPLPELVHLVAVELVSEVCSVYAARPGEILELVATEGLNPTAVGRTRLRVGEGIVGLCAATGAGDEPAGRAEPPGLRLSARDRRGAVRLHAGRAGAACRPDAWAWSRCRTAIRAATPRRRWTSWRRWRCCWPRCWRRPAPSDGAEEGVAAHGAARVRRRDAGPRDRHRPGRAARQPSSPGAAAGRRSRRRTRAPARGRRSACSGVSTN